MFKTNTEQGVVLALTGVAAIAGLSWLDSFRGGVPASPKVDGVGALGSARAAAARYAGDMKRAGVPSVQTEILEGEHALVVFPPDTHNDVWGKASKAEMAARGAGVQVALASGPDRLGVMFTGNPQVAEDVLSQQGFTSIEPSPYWA